MLDRMKTTQTSAPRRRLAAIFLAAGLAAGCATNQGAVVGADPRASFGEVRPGPSADRVIGGIAEMVLTNRLWPSFEEARENPVAVVNDGSPLYAYIRANRPLGELAHPADPEGSYTFSEYPHLFLQVGDNESLRILNTCYVTLTGDEARMREIVVPLAPLTNRPGQVPADCWLATVADARAGKRVFEVRLAGFAGKFESWLPVPDLLAVAPVPADFTGGVGEYATMLRATPMRNATLVASAASTLPTAVATPIRGSSLVAVNSAPLPGERHDLGGSRMELQLQSLSVALLGRRPSETYFVDSQWTSTTDQRGRVIQQHARAAAVFKGATCNWIPLKAFRRPGAATLIDVERAGDPIDINCSDLR